MKNGVIPIVLFIISSSVFLTFAQVKCSICVNSANEFVFPKTFPIGPASGHGNCKEGEIPSVFIRTCVADYPNVNQHLDNSNGCLVAETNETLSEPRPRNGTIFLRTRGDGMCWGDVKGGNCSAVTKKNGLLVDVCYCYNVECKPAFPKTLTTTKRNRMEGNGASGRGPQVLFALSAVVATLFFVSGRF